MSSNRPQVTVVDYGSGNLFSVARALERCGAEVRLAQSAEEIEQADRLLLPGVGAFGEGMSGLRERGLVGPIQHYAASGRPVLGICLGMQMMAGQGEEFGIHEGLGLIPGRVVPIPPSDTDGSAHKIPHIGWTALTPPTPHAWQDSMFQGTAPGTSAYLVHSFQLLPDDPSHRLADCFYGGHRIAAAVRRGRIYGCQFHPEKSGEAGLALLHAFVHKA